MWLGLYTHEKIVQQVQETIVAGHQVVQRWVGDEIIAIAHGITDLRDGVAGCTGQPNMSFRGIEELPYRSVHHAIEQQGHIVAAGAPAAWPGPDDILHVFDGLA